MNEVYQCNTPKAGGFSGSVEILERNSPVFTMYIVKRSNRDSLLRILVSKSKKCTTYRLVLTAWFPSG